MRKSPNFGGVPGGLGAKIGGAFSLTAGEVLDIYVGGQGYTNMGAYNGGAGGGGGTFVTTSGNIPLVIAGGGDGESSGPCIPCAYRGGAGLITENGGPGDDGFPGGGAGGTGGNGGGVSQDNPVSFIGGGGGGFLGPGQELGFAGGDGGGSFPGLAGGLGSQYYLAGNGGFGGGGGAGFSGGGGGGYSGGGGGLDTDGGGGGSLDAGTAQLLIAGENSGNGSVTINLLPAVVSVPESASFARMVVAVAIVLKLPQQISQL